MLCTTCDIYPIFGSPKTLDPHYLFLFVLCELVHQFKIRKLSKHTNYEYNKKKRGKKREKYFSVWFLQSTNGLLCIHKTFQWQTWMRSFMSLFVCIKIEREFLHVYNSYSTATHCLSKALKIIHINDDDRCRQFFFSLFFLPNMSLWYGLMMKLNFEKEETDDIIINKNVYQFTERSRANGKLMQIIQLAALSTRDIQKKEEEKNTHTEQALSKRNSWTLSA